MGEEIKDINKKDVKSDSNGNDFVVTDNPINFLYRRPLPISFSDINSYINNLNALTHMRKEFMSRINLRWLFGSVNGMTFPDSSSDFPTEEMVEYLKNLEGDKEALVVK